MDAAALAAVVRIDNSIRLSLYILVGHEKFELQCFLTLLFFYLLSLFFIIQVTSVFLNLTIFDIHRKEFCHRVSRRKSSTDE